MKGNAMTNDIMKVEGDFFRNLGNGVKAGDFLYQMVQSVVSSRDTTVLVRAMDRAKNKKQDAQAARTIAMVAGQVWPKAKVTKDKNGYPRITIKGIEADPNALERVKEAVDKGLSIRHTAFRKTVVGDRDKPEFELKKATLNFAKRLQREGCTKAAAMAAFEAQWDAAQG